MSLVGPRPVVPGELFRYGRYTSLYESVRPGVTGLWQASGRSTVKYEDRVKLDADYVQNWSFSRDIKIILKTVPAVLKGHGAH
jgi:exopolysaccharide production protein ExoY